MLNFLVMTNLQQLIAILIVLSSGCLAQIAPLSSIWTAGGFLNVCGGPDDSPSKERMEALQKVPPSEFMDEFKKAMADRTTDVGLKWSSPENIREANSLRSTQRSSRRAFLEQGQGFLQGHVAVFRLLQGVKSASPRLLKAPAKRPRQGLLKAHATQARSL